MVVNDAGKSRLRVERADSNQPIMLPPSVAVRRAIFQDTQSDEKVLERANRLIRVADEAVDHQASVYEIELAK